MAFPLSDATTICPSPVMSPPFLSTGDTSSYARPSGAEADPASDGKQAAATNATTTPTHHLWRGADARVTTPLDNSPPSSLETAATVNAHGSYCNKVVILTTRKFVPRQPIYQCVNTLTLRP